MPSTDPAQSLALLPAEAQLLLASAGGRTMDPTISQLLEGPVDWERLARLAVREQAWPVIHRRLGLLGVVPPAVAAPLATLAIVSDSRQRWLQTRLLDVLDSLAHAGVSAVLLKGAAIAHTAYDDVLERPMADIDVLVEGSHAGRAQAALIAAGWRPAAHAQDSRNYERHHHLHPLEDAAGAGLELHHELFPLNGPLGLSAALVRSQAREMTFNGRTTLVPDPLHQLLHAALHFSWSHYMSRGIWRTVRDIRALDNAGLLDWDAVVRLARLVHGSTCCYWTFRLANAVARDAVPTEVLDSLRPPEPDAVLRRLERHFVLGLLPVGVACPSVAASRWMWRAAILPHFSGHGGRVPWKLEPGRQGSGTAPRLTKRLRRHVQQIGVWARYVGQVAANNPPPSGSRSVSHPGALRPG